MFNSGDLRFYNLSPWKKNILMKIENILLAAPLATAVSIIV